MGSPMLGLREKMQGLGVDVPTPSPSNVCPAGGALPAAAEVTPASEEEAVTQVWQHTWLISPLDFLAVNLSALFRL